jgi:hypothetical protein
MNLCPNFPQLLSDLGVIRYKMPARSAVERFSCTKKCAIFYWCEWNYTGACAMKPYYVLEVKNALVTCTSSTLWRTMLVCAHSGVGVTLSVDLEFLNVNSGF